MRIALMIAAAAVVLGSSGETPAPPTGLVTGSISGRIVLEPPPPPRRTSRATAYNARSAVIQQLPAVVYLKGEIPGAPAPAAGPMPEMLQQDTAFVPAVLTVPVGTTVRFPNGDPFFHNVHSYSSAQRFDLGRYPQGDAKEVTFDEVGIVEVYCEVHDEMRGAVFVTENPFVTVVDENGDFMIDGIPPGEYTVGFWSADHDAQEQTVVVTEGGNVRIEVELER